MFITSLVILVFSTATGAVFFATGHTLLGMMYAACALIWASNAYRFGTEA